MIERAIFVLTSEVAGQQFLHLLPDLRSMGLSEATILHVLSERSGPAEPMPELATWVRRFEAAIPKVELALKRGDAMKWIHELARVRHVDVLVVSGIPDGVNWDFDCITSPMRTVGIPVLYLPDGTLAGYSLTDRVLLAIKYLVHFESVKSELGNWLGPAELQGVHISDSGGRGESECGEASLQVIPKHKDVATTLLAHAARQDATLITLLSYEDEGELREPAGRLVVRPLVQATRRPILIWPTQIQETG